MVEAAPAARAALAAVSAVLLSPSAEARVQEYQIVRLISYATGCQLTKLENRSPPSGPLRFFASCENVSFYPDGVDIVCADRDDDRSCRAVTQERSFDQLQLLTKPR